MTDTAGTADTWTFDTSGDFTIARDMIVPAAGAPCSTGGININTGTGALDRTWFENNGQLRLAEGAAVPESEINARRWRPLIHQQFRTGGRSA